MNGAYVLVGAAFETDAYAKTGRRKNLHGFLFVTSA